MDYYSGRPIAYTFTYRPNILVHVFLQFKSFDLGVSIRRYSTISFRLQPIFFRPFELASNYTYSVGYHPITTVRRSADLISTNKYFVFQILSVYVNNDHAFLNSFHYYITP